MDDILLWSENVFLSMLSINDDMSSHWVWLGEIQNCSKCQLNSIQEQKSGTSFGSEIGTRTVCAKHHLFVKLQSTNSIMMSYLFSSQRRSSTVTLQTFMFLCCSLFPWCLGLNYTWLMHFQRKWMHLQRRLPPSSRCTQISPMLKVHPFICFSTESWSSLLNAEPLLVWHIYPSHEAAPAFYLRVRFSICYWKGIWEAQISLTCMSAVNMCTAGPWALMAEATGD